MSYTQSFYHVIFRTYRSEQTITVEHERELYAYIYGIAKNIVACLQHASSVAGHHNPTLRLSPYVGLIEYRAFSTPHICFFRLIYVIYLQ